MHNMNYTDAFTDVVVGVTLMTPQGNTNRWNDKRSEAENLMTEQRLERVATSQLVSQSSEIPEFELLPSCL